jgi:hypothetical protein
MKKPKPKRDVMVAAGAWGPWSSKEQERHAFQACDRLAAADNPACHRDRWGAVKWLVGRLWPLLVYKNTKDRLRIMFTHDKNRILIVGAGDRSSVYDNPVARRAAKRLQERG